MNITKILSEELKVKEASVEATIKLIDEGNTIPFIARYRKEVTGGLNDEVLRNLSERLEYLRGLSDRQEAVISAIDEQGKLTEELKNAILSATTLVAVEDLYRPYKQKKKTRASIAKEKGLEPLANTIMRGILNHDLTNEAAKFVDTEKGVETAQAAIDGACDIIAETVSDNAEYRTWIRENTIKSGIISSKEKGSQPEESVYRQYFEYAEPITKTVGHRVLALNRGEAEKALTVSIEAPVDDIIRYLEKQVISPRATDFVKPALSFAIADSYKRLIAPSIENEIRTWLTENAEDGAIKVFGSNLTQLLMQPPIAGRTVLGWDPAFRTGCKLSVVDSTGKVLDTTVIYPTAPQNKVTESVATVKKLIDKYDISLISLGNGTASRESEQIIADMLKTLPKKVEYVIVNEAGASVYSASKLATEEFPNFDVGQRSATSMARRLQDPLSELVKIEPKALGVGQYQHDMNQKKLEGALTGVVEDCVNKVGVDLNTASVPLLSYVSGINKTLAKNIVDYREENGSFKSRSELKKVPKLGPKAYEQCAGFLRIRGGKNPLDATAVHPESYEAAKALIEFLGYKPSDLSAGSLAGVAAKVHDIKKLAEKLGVGEPTLKDIIAELEKPGRDPREDMPAPILKSDVLSMDDLTPGMALKGTVRNIVDFGVFVDIGVHQDGLVHISKLSKKFVKHPLDVVKVGDILDVTVIDVDKKRGRISLSAVE